MTRNDLVERMILNHNPNSAPRMVIEQCADVAMREIDVLNRDIARLRSDLESACTVAKMLREQLAAHDDTATAHEEDSAELAEVIALLDEFDAPRVQDTHTLTPADRLRLYLDQRADERREAAEDDAAEWSSDAYVQRGLVLAIAELGHALERGAR